MKTKLHFYAIQKLKNALKLNGISSLLIIFFMTFSSYSQSDGIEFEFDCSGTAISVEFGQPDISGTYYIYPEGTAFAGETEIQMNWFVVFETAINEWVLKGPTTQDGSGVPVTFFINNTTAAFPSDNLAEWSDSGAGGGFPCTLINITYTGSSGDPDNDGDGFLASVDCDDNDNTIYPGATELCDGKDNNCDTIADEGLTFITYYADLDGDGFGDPDNSISTCDGAPIGYVEDNTDCFDDGIDAETAYPGAEEITFDAIDNDCDGLVDEDDNPPVVYDFCDDQDKKVLICHNGKTKCVSINAVDAHLAHGDDLGSCDRFYNDISSNDQDIKDQLATEFNAISWPNPSNDSFNIKMITPNTIDKVDLKTFDMNGRLILSNLINGNEDYQFGGELSSGIYFVRLSQADITKVIKLIKQ